MGSSGSKSTSLQLSPNELRCLEHGDVDLILLRRLGAAINSKRVPDGMTYADLLMWLHEHTRVPVKTLDRVLLPYIDQPIAMGPHGGTPIRMIDFDANTWTKNTRFDTLATRVFQQLLAFKVTPAWVMTVSCDTNGNATSRFLSSSMKCNDIIPEFQKIGKKRHIHMCIQQVADMRKTTGPDAGSGECEFLIWRAGDPSVEPYVKNMPVENCSFSNTNRLIVGMPNTVCRMPTSEQSTGEFIQVLARRSRELVREEPVIAYGDEAATFARDAGPAVVISCATARTGSGVHGQMSKSMQLSDQAAPVLRLIGCDVEVATASIRATV